MKGNLPERLPARALYRLGKITRPRRLDDGQLREARGLHLLALQVESGREDFGETFEGADMSGLWFGAFRRDPGRPRKNQTGQGPNH